MIRIIPRIDIKGPNLVKGVHFEGLRVLGKPEFFARSYYEAGADELYYVDAVASLYGRNSLIEIIERTSREIFIPLAVGGGLRSVDDIRAVLRAGADKVSLNTAAMRRPEFISEASRTFGASTIMVAIEAQKMPDGSFECLTEYGRERTGTDAIEWAVRAVELGAGELVVTAVHQDGTGTGFDLELTRAIAERVSVPVIASGGAGRAQHIVEVLTVGQASAVSVASLLHYNTIRHVRALHAGQDPVAGFEAEGNVEFLTGRSGGAVFDRLEVTTLHELKRVLREHGLSVRDAA